MRAFLLSLFGFTTFCLQTIPVRAAEIDAWWPVDGAAVSGVQPFKAVVHDQPVDSYSMFWQVDGGGLNPMDIDLRDAPHREASVDLTPWTWQPSGAYAVTFVAKDPTDQVIAQKTVQIHVQTAGVAMSPEVSSSLSSITPASSESSVSVATPSSSVVSSSSVVPVSSSSSSSSVSTSSSSSVTPLVLAGNSRLAVWWPEEGAMLSGEQPFKAAMGDSKLESYSMTWSVDGGQPNAMNDSRQDGPHKEVMVNLAGWSWKGEGPYVVTFRAKDRQGRLMAEKTVSIRVTQGGSASSTSVSTSSSASSSSSVASSASTSSIPASSSSQPMSVSGGNPLAGVTLYVDPTSQAKRRAAELRTSNAADAALIDKIANQPQARWLGGWNADVGRDVSEAVQAAARQNAVPTFVLYNIPQRDCGGYSAGGTNDPASYRGWIRTIASAIGSNRAVIVLEPDALALTDCLSSQDRQVRFDLLSFAVQTLKAQGNVAVYLDAGHPAWRPASDMAGRLSQAGVDRADGFALNTSNFETEQANAAYGREISQATGGKHFVVDSSRNGRGPLAGQWCNPADRALGRMPTAATGDPLIDAYLWIKAPGESDGACNGGPDAGVFWTEYALGLARRAAW